MTLAEKSVGVQNPKLVLALFVVIHTLLSLDRSVISILLEPIRQEFELSDSQLGLLTGFTFAFFFGIAGLPLGRLVDHSNRRNILAGSVLLFSGVTALTAATTNFLQMLVSRMIVGAGEAGGNPAMASILADLYPPERRSRAMAIFYTGVPIGAIIAYLVGG
jgi:predicted MFS family arabinose efflux permease